MVSLPSFKYIFIVFIFWWIAEVSQNTLSCKHLGLASALICFVSYAHQGSIYLIKITLWNIITI